MKGAPEVILSQCTKYANNDEICDISEEFKESCQVRYWFIDYRNYCSLLIFRQPGIILVQQEKELCMFEKSFEVYMNYFCRAFAQKHFISKKDTKFSADSNNYPKDDLIFLGLCAMIDPPRNEAATAIQQCKYDIFLCNKKDDATYNNF